ncbi:MAG: precorrin-6y C5,15-methyltransferase (decarboxylating) subunit CbiE [Myxacorys californica WJT36-NPBG1]|nr:precorrin-6y C5,15-methyltransferase (decarboxylating) subunit CbiE [Myxacorys californica WJT36-NPBG1]
MTSELAPPPIHVVGIGLDGAAGLSASVKHLAETADVLVGSDRHLSYFPNHVGDRIRLSNFNTAIAQIKQHPPVSCIVILTSGDPLFFGFGRLLLEAFPPEQLTFHPHLSSVQLAFSRVKLSWHDARIISAHGRSLDELIGALSQGVETIAVLTDASNSPSAIASLLLSLDLPSTYRVWVCENLGGSNEQILEVQDFRELQHQTFAALNVVILNRQNRNEAVLQALPLFGLPDQSFLSFSDRPGLMTKREIRVLAIAELALQSDQIVWDIGAGTGSVAIEIARLCPASQIFAIEKTAAGVTLIQKNADRFGVNNIQPIHGAAPQVLEELPPPDRVFIGGSGGNLEDILKACMAQLAEEGVIVLALATLEHLTQAMTSLKSSAWNYRLLQVQIARSTPIAALTRFTPLNPVTLITLTRP